MRDGLFLCLDQGGQSSRALVFDEVGRVMAQHQIPVSTSCGDGGVVEQDPQEIIQSLQQAAEGALQRLPSSAPVIAAGLVCQRSSMVCWERYSRHALTPVISWQDTRGAEILEARRVDVPWMRQKTGLFPNAHYGASKMRWCLDHVPLVRQAAAAGTLCMSPLAAWCVALLTEEHRHVVDPANAGRTLLCHLDRADWDDDLLSFWGIQREWLPIIRNTRDDFGCLSVNGHRIPLVYCNGDQSSAALAYGWPEANTLRLNMGTGLFLMSSWSETHREPDRLLRSEVYRCEGKRVCVVEAAINGGASALNWWRQQELVQTESARETPVFVNAVGGIGSPWWRHDVVPHFAGEGSVQQQEQAVLDSMAFMVKANVELLETAGYRYTQLSVSGGLSALTPLCQRLADVLNLPLLVAEQTEASAMGMLVAMGGTVSLPALSASLVPSNHGAASTDYECWRAIFERELSAALDRHA